MYFDLKGSAVLTHPEKGKPLSYPEIKQDMRDLAELFRETLEPVDISAWDSEIKDNLLMEMNSESDDLLNSVLRYPYFWDVSKKLDYLSKVAHFTKSPTGGKVKQKLNEYSASVFDNDWATKLAITDLREKDKINKGLEKRRNERTSQKRRKKTVNVSEATIKEFSKIGTKRKMSRCTIQKCFNLCST